MALPTLEKTWQFNVNQVTAPVDVSTDRRNLWFKIKQILTSFPTNPWTVVRSSNSVTVANSDLWLTAANIIQYNDSNAHSWIVLQQTNMNGGTFQLLLDCNGTGGQYGSISFSHVAGFTGGTTLLGPTATDGALPISHTYWSNLTASASVVTHAMMSTDGQCTRLFAYAGGVCILYFLLDTLADCPIQHNASCVWVGDPSVRSANNLLSGTYWYSYNATNSVNIWCYMATECYNGTAVPVQSSGVIHNLVAAYPMTPLSIHSAVAGNRGRVGRVVDAWMGSSAIPDGSTFPTVPADREFIMFRGFILPWNGSVPQIV
jgi:hypothetical protein